MTIKEAEKAPDESIVIGKVFRNMRTEQLIEIVGREVENGEYVLSFSPLGGGFVAKIWQEDFFIDHIEHDVSDALKPCYVSIDGCGDIKYQAYASEHRWNGWAIPWFSIDEARKVAMAIPGLMVTEKDIRAACEIEQAEEDGVPGQGIYSFSETLVEMPDGQQKTMSLCRLGDGWCWEFVE